MPHPAPSRRAEYAQFREIPTRWSDVDVYGHVNNVVHYAMFDTAVGGWLIEKGLLAPATSPSFGVVVETGCRYFGEITYPSVVTAGLRLGTLGRSSVRFEIGLFADDAEVAAAEGFFTHVYVDRATRRPHPIEPERRAAFETLRLPQAG
ncbi:acyl-CoA thioesterase [Roseisalinus antarcticus]|uniref:Thioesterase superfamily protein n=1 Tax=Roseisalinus antarcticus TaxID=254357 RepID=A0A1Y5RY65_9RHOB|nr:thioesterase family protein [Roseisalinus antarcticus]SLN25631.1 Thioesterase superfamily protein [Roseisalinus antarcticus]